MMTSLFYTIKVVLFLLVITCSSVQAQKLNIHWGQASDEGHNDVYKNLLYDDGTYYYFEVFYHKIAGGAIVPAILKFDRKFNLIKRYDIETFEPTVEVHGIFYLDGKFLLFYSKKMINTNHELMGIQIDKTTFVPDKAKSVIKIQTDTKLFSTWDFTTSADSTMLLIYTTYQQKMDEPKKLDYCLIRNDYSVVQRQSLTFDFPEKNCRISGIKINKSGDVYIAAKGYQPAEGETKEQKKNPVNQILLKKYSPDGTEKTILIPLGTKQIGNYNIEIDPQNEDLYVIGTYRNHPRMGVFGYFFLRADSKSGESKVYTEHEFNSQLINKINSMHSFFKPEPSAGMTDSIKVDDIIIDSQSNVYGILVDNTIIRSGDGTTGSGFTQFAEGIIALKLNSSGNQLWINQISRKSETNFDFLYHFSMVSDDKLFIFYNDHPENSALDPYSEKMPKKVQGAYNLSLVSVELGKSGTMTKKILLTEEKDEFMVKTSYSKQLNANTAFINSYRNKGKKSKLGLIKYE